MAKDHPAQASSSRSLPASPKAITCSGPSPNRALRACTAVPLLTPAAVNSRFSAKEVTISSAPQAAARSIRDFRRWGST